MTYSYYENHEDDRKIIYYEDSTSKRKESDYVFQKIKYISIDYLLFLILDENEEILKNINKNFDRHMFILFFMQQHKIFMETSVLFDKIISIYNYYSRNDYFLKGLLTFLHFFLFYVLFQSSQDLNQPIFLILNFFLKEIKTNLLYSQSSDCVSTIQEIVDEIINSKYDKKNLLKSFKFINNIYNKVISKYFIKNLIHYKQLQQIQSILINNFNKNKSFDISPINTFLLTSSAFEDTQESHSNKKIGWIFDIFQWSASEIAKQMTIQTEEYYSNLLPEEFFKIAWTKKDKEKTSPNILRLIERFNQLFYWIIEEVLCYDKKANRCKVIEKFICVALFLKEYRNYNDLLIIVSALNSNIIKKLEKTLNLIGQVYKKHWNDLTSLCSPEKNYYLLRKFQSNDNFSINDNENEEYSSLDKTIRGSKLSDHYSPNITETFSLKTDICRETQIIPYLGLLLRDIIFCVEGCTYTDKGNFVNVDIIFLQSYFIYNFTRFKNRNYQFESIPQFDFLRHPNPMSEESLYDIVDNLEPKFKNSTKSNEKRPSNTDLHYFTLVSSSIEFVNKEANVLFVLNQDFIK